MRIARIITGFAALILAAVAANLLVMTSSPFAGRIIVILFLAGVLFLIWIVLSATDLASKLRRQRTFAGINTVLSCLIFLAICITVYAFSKLWDVEWDLTQEGRRDLAQQTIQILETLDEDVKVTGFFLSGPTGDQLTNAAREKTRRFLERCQRHTDRLSFEFVDPQRRPERLQQLNVKSVSGTGIVVMEVGSRQKQLAISDVTGRLEERDFTNALINLVRDVHPVVYFMAGHGEADIQAPADDQKGATNFANWLGFDGYAVRKLVITPGQPAIPDDCAALIINGYVVDYRPNEVQAIDEYMLSGGRLLLLVNPSFPKETKLQQVERIRPWVRNRFGVEVAQDVVVSLATGKPSLQLLFTPGAYQGERDPESPFKGAFNQRHPITRGHDQVMTLPTARTVRPGDNPPKGVVIDPLLRSSVNSYGETELQRIFDEGFAQFDGNEEKGPLPVAVAATLKNDTVLPDGGTAPDGRAVIIGDTEIATNEFVNAVGNHTFLLNAMAWLTENEELIAIRPTGQEDPPLIMSATEQRVVVWLACLGTVQAVAIAGLVVYYLRRRNV